MYQVHERMQISRQIGEIKKKLNMEEGDLILFAADQWLTACEILGKIRLYCAETLKTQGKLSVPLDRFDFLWVVDFPLLSFDKEQNRWYSSHHPFTASQTRSAAATTPLAAGRQRFRIRLCVSSLWKAGGRSMAFEALDSARTPARRRQTNHRGTARHKERPRHWHRRGPTHPRTPRHRTKSRSDPGAAPH